MSAVVQALFDICDAVGIQNAYLCLALVIVTGPFFLFAATIRDPTVWKSFTSIQRASFAGIWKYFAGPVDKRYAAYKKPLLKEVSGVVVDLGSGRGDNLKYFDPSKITRLYLIEPNPGMHAALKENVRKAGFRDAQFEIVPCGAEEKSKVEQMTGLSVGSADSVTSVLALCGIPGSRKCIAALYDYLKPGGKFYFFEHVASKDPSTRKLQERLTPTWRFLFGGCEINRSTDRWILEAYEWADQKTFTVDFESQKNLDVKSYGWAKKPTQG